MSTNVDGARNAAEFTAPLRPRPPAPRLHLLRHRPRRAASPSAVDPAFSPCGEPFDVEAECAEVAAASEQIIAAHESPDAEAAALTETLRQMRAKGQDEGNAMLLRNILRRVKRSASRTTSSPRASAGPSAGSGTTSTPTARAWPRR
jgi:hypothetical protein